MILLTESNFSGGHIDYEALRSKKRRRIHSLSTESPYNETIVTAATTTSPQQPTAVSQLQPMDKDTGDVHMTASPIPTIPTMPTSTEPSTDLVVPDFNCTAVLNNEFCRIQLSNLLQAYKAVVLFFYESDFTQSAMSDISLINRHFERLQRLNAVPLAMSTDTEMVHAAFLKQSSLSFTPFFPLVADTTRSISRHFNVTNPTTGLAQRSAFIIDRSRKVRFSFVLEDNRLSHSMDTICNIIQNF